MTILVSLCELAKTCNFCSEGYTQKNIRDQIIEGLADGEIVEDLLQKSGLSLATTISKCRAKEATKQQCAEISDRAQSISALHRSNTSTQPKSTAQVCPGCGSKPHPASCMQHPAYSMTCFLCQKVGHMATVNHSVSMSRWYKSPLRYPLSQNHPQKPHSKASRPSLVLTQKTSYCCPTLSTWPPMQPHQKSRSMSLH